MRVLFVRRHYDENIAHFLYYDVFQIWSFLTSSEPVCGQISIDVLFVAHDENKTSHRWRRDLLLACGYAVHHSHEVISENAYQGVYEIETGRSVLEVTKFLKYDRYAPFVRFAERALSSLLNSNVVHSDILLVQRSKSRELRDFASGSLVSDLLSDYCEERGLRLNVVCFDGMSFHDQVQCFNLSRTVIAAHGAELTNLIFLRSSARVIEVAFRKLWQCDPVCDAHFSGALRPTEKCGSGFNFFPYFHKADFHNLCSVFAVEHFELNAVECGVYLDRNPINVDVLYINIGELLERL